MAEMGSQGEAAPKDDFVHLYVHTDYSMLDGAGKIKDYVVEAKRLGQPALATTNHNCMFEAHELYTAATAAGIKPVIRAETYMAPGTSRFDKTHAFQGDESQQSSNVSARGSYTYMTLLSCSNKGPYNLMRMDSFVSLEGQWGKTLRVDRESLLHYANGLIGSTGCPSSEVQTRPHPSQRNEALRVTGELQDIFGRGFLYTGFMDRGLKIEQRVTGGLLRIIKEARVPLPATGDSHYVRPKGYTVQNVILCINSGSMLSDPDRFRLGGDTYHLYPGAEIHRLFSKISQAYDNILFMTEQCSTYFRTMDEGASYTSALPAPGGETDESWFIKECWRDIDRRFNGDIPEDCRKQAEYKINVIIQTGFPGCFLVMVGYINRAKAHDIRVGPGRGSGVGSVVVYAMGIAELNPLRHGLIFERLLNPERISMPSIGIDFDEYRRDKVIEYIRKKYDADRINQMVAYSIIKARQFLKNSSYVMGHPYVVGDRLIRAVPPSVQSKDISIKSIFSPTDEHYSEAEGFCKLHIKGPDAQGIIGLAKGLEGTTRQWGVHACAVIMSSTTSTDIIPMMQHPQDGAIIIQLDHLACEHLGLLEMNFPGPRSLTVISGALESIVANGKPALDIDHIELGDRTTYELLSRGKTLNVFQLDGGGMRTLLRLMEPSNFEGTSVAGALYRPGPMRAESHTNCALCKNGLQEVTSIHSELKEAPDPILETTYGLIVYQGQVTRVATDLVGFSTSKADALHKAMDKRKIDILARMFVEFETGTVQPDLSKESIKTLRNVAIPFAKYAFNKAYSAAHGVVSYWTAYLKTHYLTEYMVVLLASQRDNKDKLAIYLGECRHIGITVLLPDVNVSRAQLFAVGEGMRLGLSAARNISIGAVDAIVTAREDKGRFTFFEGSLDKAPAIMYNKHTIDSFIKARAFDSLGHTRRSLQVCHEGFVDGVISIRRNEAAGRSDLLASLMGGLDDADNSPFGNGPVFPSDAPNLPEWGREDELAYRHDMLSLYVSDHPLMGLEGPLGKLTDRGISELHENGELPDGAMVTIAGLVTSLTHKTAKQGNLWATARAKDLAGSIEVSFSFQTYQTVSTILAPDTAVAVRGRLNRRDGQIVLYTQEIAIPDISNAAHEAILITLPANRCIEPLMKQFKDILTEYPGGSTVRLTLTSPRREVRTQLDTLLRAETSPALYSDIKTLLDPRCPRHQRAASQGMDRPLRQGH